MNSLIAIYHHLSMAKLAPPRSFVDCSVQQICSAVLAEDPSTKPLGLTENGFMASNGAANLLPGGSRGSKRLFLT